MNKDGSAASTKFDGKFTNSYGTGHGNFGREFAVSSISGKSGKAVFWVDYTHDDKKGKLLVYPQAAIAAKKDSNLSILGETSKLELSRTANISKSNEPVFASMMRNVKGGIFLPNDDK